MARPRPPPNLGARMRTRRLWPSARMRCPLEPAHRTSNSGQSTKPCTTTSGRISGRRISNLSWRHSKRFSLAFGARIANRGCILRRAAFPNRCAVAGARLISISSQSRSRFWHRFCSRGRPRPQLLLASNLRGSFFRIVGRRRDRHAVNEHRWHWLLRFDAQIADAFSDQEGISFPRREPFDRLVVSVQGSCDFFCDAVQIKEAHGYFVAQVAGKARDLLRVLALQFVAPNRGDGPHRHKEGGRTDNHDVAVPRINKKLRLSRERSCHRAFDRDEHQNAVVCLQAWILLVAFVSKVIDMTLHLLHELVGAEASLVFVGG